MAFDDGDLDDVRFRIIDEVPFFIALDMGLPFFRDYAAGHDVDGPHVVRGKVHDQFFF